MRYEQYRNINYIFVISRMITLQCGYSLNLIKVILKCCQILPIQVALKYFYIPRQRLYCNIFVLNGLIHIINSIVVPMICKKEFYFLITSLRHRPISFSSHVCECAKEPTFFCSVSLNVPENLIMQNLSIIGKKLAKQMEYPHCKRRKSHILFFVSHFV